MGNWKDNLTVFIPVVVLTVTLNMLRELLAVDIEERIGRKLTDWEWQYFLQERNRKEEAEARQRIVGQWWESEAVRQKIYDFVWNGHF